MLLSTKIEIHQIIEFCSFCLFGINHLLNQLCFQERVPTPCPTYATNRPGISNKFVEPCLSPEAKKKAAAALTEIDRRISFPSNGDTTSNSSNPQLPDIPLAIFTTGSSISTSDGEVEKLRNETNLIIDRMLNKMVSNIEGLRKNIMNEITEAYGDGRKIIEKFEDEIDTKSDRENLSVNGEEDDDGHSNSEDDDAKNVESESKTVGFEEVVEKDTNSNVMPVEYD